MLKSKLLAILALGIISALAVGELFARSALFTLFTDMFNQTSIKPMEKGGITSFPIGAVSFDGAAIEDPEDRFSRILLDLLSDKATPNPFKPPDPESLANGKLMYNTYCAVCHGTTREINKEGFAKTKVNEEGMIAPALLLQSHFFSDGYIFHKIKYGGPVMPAMGYAISAKERWDIVNYIRTLEKKGDS